MCRPALPSRNLICNPRRRRYRHKLCNRIGGHVMFARILVPLDGTAESNVALPAARTLARQTGGTITLLRVVSKPYSSDERMVFEEVNSALKRIADDLASGDVHVEWLVRRGEVVNEILCQSREQPTDIIVMRTHGRAGLERAVLGRTTERALPEGTAPGRLLG